MSLLDPIDPATTDRLLEAPESHPVHDAVSELAARLDAAELGGAGKGVEPPDIHPRWRAEMDQMARRFFGVLWAASLEQGERLARAMRGSS